MSATCSCAGLGLATTTLTIEDDDGVPTARTFDAAYYATGVVIREVAGNGFVTRVELKSGSTYYTIGMPKLRERARMPAPSITSLTSSSPSRRPLTR